MKKTIAMSAFALAVSFGSISCKKKVSDADLQTQATTIVTANPSATVEVKEGVAHLGGTFASQAEKDAAIKSLKEIKGVKDVHDMAKVEEMAPPPPPVENYYGCRSYGSAKSTGCRERFPYCKSRSCKRRAYSYRKCIFCTG